MAKHIERTISNKAFWQINKHLALSIGIRETLLLQHFIDLQSNIFKDADDFFHHMIRLKLHWVILSIIVRKLLRD